MLCVTSLWWRGRRRAHDLYVNYELLHAGRYVAPPKIGVDILVSFFSDVSLCWCCSEECPGEDIQKVRLEKHTPKLASKRANDSLVSESNKGNGNVGGDSNKGNGSSGSAAGEGSGKREHSSPVDITIGSKENISPEKSSPIKYGELIVVGWVRLLLCMPGHFYNNYLII